MKNLLLIALFAFASTGLFAQSNDSKSIDGPVMEFETMEVDYGNIMQGSEPLRTVKFTNTGTTPLIISNARGSCGCTVPTWPKEPVMPGETSVIEVRYDTKRVGPINKTITITANDNTGTHTLRVKGLIKKEETPESVPKKESIFQDANDKDGQ